MFQITLRAARLHCGYTLGEAARRCDVKSNELYLYEVNSFEIPRNLLTRLTDLYNIPPDLIYFGPEKNCVKHNHRNQFSGNNLVTQSK